MQFFRIPWHKMGKDPLHIIHKQFIEISTDDVTDAREIEGRYKELIKQINSPSFEDCFKDLLPPDQHLLIERMEINLGKFNKKDLFSEFGIHLGYALREALLTNISQKSSSIAEAAKKGKSGRLKEPLRGNGYGKSSEVASSLKGPFEAFVFFLERG